MRKLLLPMCLTLVGCMPGNMADTPSRDFVQESALGLPPLKSFATSSVEAPTRSNIDIARDFLELSFHLESGRELPVLTRFEGPISIRVTGAPPATLLPDLTRLIYRFQSEARLNVSLTNAPDANITVQAVSRADIRKNLPHAACFVVPNISDISEYKSARRSAKTNWAQLRQRNRLAVFVPNDASPQEVRDCLHEELAQAIGPLNDLYRLPDSVFNDDNMHTVLTGFDMLVLRAYYAPELRNWHEQTSGRLRATRSSRPPQSRGRGPQPRARGANPPQLYRRCSNKPLALAPACHSAARLPRKPSRFRAPSAGRITAAPLPITLWAGSRYNPIPTKALKHFQAADQFYANSRRNNAAPRLCRVSARLPMPSAKAMACAHSPL